MLDITESLVNGYSITMVGNPGSGTNEAARQASLLLQRKHPNVPQIFIDQELVEDSDEFIKAAFRKLLKNRKIDDEALRRYLVEQKVVIILLHKEENLPEYLKKLHENNRRNLTILKIINSTNANSLENGKSLVYIPNIDLKNIDKLIALFNDEYNWSIDEKLSKRILFLSGGNYEIIKNIFRLISERGEEISTKPQILLQNPTISAILEGFSKVLAKRDISELLKLNIITSNGTLFSKLLQKYLDDYELPQGKILFSKLTPTDRQILTVFINNPNTIISKEQITLFLEQDADSTSEWAIYKAVERLKNKVKGQFPLCLKKGQGWMLETK